MWVCRGMWEAQTDSRVLTIGRWSCIACYAVSVNRQRLERSVALPFPPSFLLQWSIFASIQRPNHPISGNHPRLGQQGTYALCTQLKYITKWVLWLWKFGKGYSFLQSRVGRRGSGMVFSQVLMTAGLLDQQEQKPKQNKDYCTQTGMSQYSIKNPKCNRTGTVIFTKYNFICAAQSI